MPDRTYAVSDLTERFGVGEHTVLTWIRSGELKALNLARSAGAKRPSWRVTPEALKAFEAARSASPPVPGVTRKRVRSTDVISFY